MPPKNLTELLNEFSKVATYKINIQNLLCFYTLITNYQKEKLIKNIILTIASKTMKYLGII